MKKLVVFRVDASPEIGSGHMHRCLLLAAKLHDIGFIIHFLCVTLNSHYKYKILDSKYGLDVIPSPDNEITLHSAEKAANDYNSKIIVIDSDLDSLSDPDFQKQLKSHNWKLMYFVFFPGQKLWADIILNQNIRAPGLDYRVSSSTIKLLGTEYVIFSDDFIQWGKSRPSYEDKKENLFIYFGGSDPGDHTLPVLSMICESKLKFDKIMVVAGSLNPRLSALKSFVKNNAEVELHIQTPRMAELMAEAKYAIASGGLSLWELAVSNVLQIIIPGSEREKLTLDYCREQNLVFGISDLKNLNSREFIHKIKACFSDPNAASMVQRFSEQVKLDGIYRIVKTIDKVTDGERKADR